MNLELFPCSGGMAEGFRRAGVTFDLSFDHDKDACDSYEKNLGHRPVQMDVHDLVRMARAGWRPGEAIDLLVADPPCTPWSRAGKRLGRADERDCLDATTELIRLWRPRAYLIGNVPGLQDSTNWRVVQDAIGGLGAHGYCVADYVSLDAADYGVPQHRVRPFWYGHLDGPCVRWPSPTHGNAYFSSEPGVGHVMPFPGLGLKAWVTCREALQHLPLEKLGRPVRLKRLDPKHPPREADSPATTVRSGGNGNSAPHVVIANHRHPPASPASPAATIGAKDRGQSTTLYVGEVTSHENYRPFEADEPAQTIRSGGEGVAQRVLAMGEPARRKRPASTKGAQSERIGTPDATAPTLDSRPARIGDGAAKVVTWPWDRPATVVHSDAGGRLAPPGHHEKSFMSDNRGHGPNAIVLSEEAAAALQGFPDGWCFSGDTKRVRWAQIGMAMPPGLAEAVARAIVAARRGGA